MRRQNPILVLYDVKQVQAAEVSQRRTAVGSKCFQLYYTCSDRLLTIALPPCPFHLFFPTYCDVSQALSYFASTILQLMSLPQLVHKYSILQTVSVRPRHLISSTMESLSGSRCNNEDCASAVWETSHCSYRKALSD
jgi:hypothetical protein